MKSRLWLFPLAMFVLASPVFAQTPAPAEASNAHWMWISAAFAMAIASAVCGLAQGRAVAAACESAARNPGAGDRIQFFLILGLALIESLSLYTLAIIILKVK
jgi:F-type H+-transporting ATPase subunit c